MARHSAQTFLERRSSRAARPLPFVLAVCFITAGAWATFTKMDIFASARGVVVSEGGRVLLHSQYDGMVSGFT
jgi:hypothetical protein